MTSEIGIYPNRLARVVFWQKGAFINYADKILKIFDPFPFDDKFTA